MRRLVIPLLAILLAGVTLTQWLAWQARYARALGSPLVVWRGHSLYAPWQGVVWVRRWGWEAPEVVMWPLCTALSIAILGTMVLGGKGQARRRRAGEPPPATGHGTDRWAQRKELRAMGLAAKKGTVIGRVGRTVLRFDGEENVLVVMGQRQGKGVGIFLPTLLGEPNGHVIVTDVREETYRQTAGYRATISRVLRYDLTSETSAKHNPFLEIRRGTTDEYGDAYMIADMLVDPESAKDTKDHWEQTARNMLTAGILYSLYRDRRPSLSGLASRMSTPNVTLLELMTRMRDDAPTPLVAELTQEVLSKDLREASGVLSSFLVALAPWRNPVIAANTETSDFHLAELLNPTRLISLYLMVNPANDLLIRTPLRVFLNQLLRRLSEAGGPKAHGTKATLLLDEFPFFGRVEFFLQHLGVLGGYGMPVVLAAQNIPQLGRLYDRADNMIEQCQVQVYGAAQGNTTADTISRQTGTTTATTEVESYSRQWGTLHRQSTQITEQQHGRALLLPSEARQISGEHLVILRAGYPAVWAKKVKFWEERVWKHRSELTTS